MPRKQAIFPEVNFVKGLITETTALRYPENACVETWDCIFDNKGTVTRRPGVDLEDNYTALTVSSNSTANAYQSYLWETVGTQGTVSFYVQQRGNDLLFFSAGDTTDFSPNGIFQTINLSSYIPAGSSEIPRGHRCSFTQGRGHLIVANPAIDPIYIKYIEATDSLEANTISIKYRDFTGYEDGLEVYERPAYDSIADLISFNPKHYYNLLNQGWHLTSFLTRWETFRSDMPSNMDVPSYYRRINNDGAYILDGNLIDTRFGEYTNTPAGKGHFILDAGSPSRQAAMLAEGFVAVVPDSSVSSVPLASLTTRSGGTIIRPTAAFDGNADQTFSNSTIMNVNSYLGKSFSSGTKISSVVITTPTDIVTFSRTVYLYGKTGAAPTSSIDGTLLGTVDINTVGLGKSVHVINSSDVTTEYNHFWIRTNADYTLNIAELEVLSPTPSYNRPSIVSFFAGRVFYAGLPNEGSTNSVYFTQILERDSQYGLCYQKNDPTSAEFFDILSDDGGVIVIPDIGRITAMFALQNSLLLMATNGVWLVSGSNRGPFQATDYSVRKISSISTTSGSSIIDRRGIPFWWAEDGIYTVQFDANYDTFSVVSITDATIKSFIQDIPVLNRRFVKGSYDAENDRLVWIYNRTSNLTTADYYSYNTALCMDGQTGAFYPWRIPFATYRIKDIVFARDVVGEASPKIKFFVQSGSLVSFAELKDTTNYVDWFSTNAMTNDYESYFVTGYRIHGETQKFSQINYIFVFLDQLSNSSLYMQAIHDFTSTPNTGKWSTPQQCYNSSLIERNVNHRRLKVRGKGKAIQLKMYSESGKPFSCIGWSTNESVNEQI